MIWLLEKEYMNYYAIHMTLLWLYNLTTRSYYT